MLKKIIIGVLVLTVVGAGGAAFAYTSASQDTDQIGSAPEPILSEQGKGVGQNGDQGQGGPVQAAEGSEGQPWKENGTITEIDEYGFQLSYQNGQTAYVELGPPPGCCS